MSFSFSFKPAPKKTGLAANPKVDVVIAGFGDDSSSDEGGADMVARSIKAQTEKNDKLMKELVEKAEEETPGVYDYEKNYDEMLQKKTAVEKAKREHAKSSNAKWIGDMKSAAAQRERDRELTDIRLIQREAESTNQFYEEVDSEIAPIVTSGYRKKIAEQREREEKEANEAKKEAENAVERKGFASFNSFMLNARTATEAPTEKPEEDYQKELEGLIFKQDQQKKKDRRERYLKMKQDQRNSVIKEEEEKEKREEEEEAEAAAKAAEEAAKKEQQEAEAAKQKEQEEENNADGENTEDVNAGSTAKTIDKLAYLDEHRKKLVQENRIKRMTRRNDKDDLERAKLRFLKRKVASIQRA
eukprot:TRINITY_DN7849_c0_g1_i2.p2 TRINITY_DN7849_c0_g1~~TRINITY_DN7849_c0_g1_i2.p2  ORF type:complete len:358 (+),score=142.24 TRINITY_DN7849_c0_g1_i2:2138-3211(+)